MHTAQAIDIYLSAQDLTPLSVYKKNMPFKWVTFIKNDSFFIALYQTINIYSAEEFTLYHNHGDELVVFKNHALHMRQAPVISKFLLKGEYPEYIIEINNGQLCLPATIIEKQLYARYNFIASRLTPFKKTIMPKLAGRVRLFGHNYIYIVGF